MENLFLVQVSTGKSGINGDFQGFKYVITIIKQSFLQFPNSMDPTTILQCYISSCKDHLGTTRAGSSHDLHGTIFVFSLGECQPRVSSPDSSDPMLCQLGWYSPNSDHHWSSDLYRFYEWLTSLIFVQDLLVLIFHVWHVIDANGKKSNNDSTTQ